MCVCHPAGYRVTAKKAQPQPEAPQAEDLDLEIVQLRQALSAMEVEARRLDRENLDVNKELKDAREQLSGRNQKISELEALNAALTSALRESAYKGENLHAELEKARASLLERQETVDGLVTLMSTNEPG